MYPVGVASDRYGPRLVSMFGCLLFAFGCALLAVSDLSLGWLHHIGYCIMAAGGICVYVPSLQLCRILPRISSLMMALLTGAFDMSAMIFVLLKIVYGELRETVSIHGILAIYALLPAISFVLVTSFYPNGSIAIAPDSQKGAGGGDDFDRSQKQGSQTPKKLNEVIKTADFWLLALFIGIMTSRFNVFLATFNIRLARSNLDDAFQRSILGGFQTLFPIGGVISMSAVGQMLQSFSMATNMLVVSAVMVVWGLVMQVMTKDFQAMSVLICALSRPYFYAATNQLSERLFGSGRFGRVYGALLAVSAVVNLASLHLVYTPLDPGLSGLGLVSKFTETAVWGGVFLPLYLYQKNI